MERASTNALRSRVLNINVSCSRNVRMRFLRTGHHKIGQGGRQFGRPQNNAFCCFVMRASSRAVLSDERSGVLLAGEIMASALVQYLECTANRRTRQYPKL